MRTIDPESARANPSDIVPGSIDAITLVSTVIFGFWQDPDLRVSRLAQMAGRREVKLFVRWNVLDGEVMGPRFTDARTNDHLSPFSQEELLAECWYLADLGFFGIKRLLKIAQEQKGESEHRAHQFARQTSGLLADVGASAITMADRKSMLA